MASPDPEWLLWREQYKIHSKSVSDRLSFLTQAISQLEDATTKMAELAAKSNHLEAQKEALNNRIGRLENNVKQQNSINEHLQADNDRFRCRIVHLEQDANQQDQINAMHTQTKDELEVKLGKLKGDFLNVIEAVGTMQETMKAEREKQRKEWAEMKASMNTAAQTHPAPNAREEMNFARRLPAEARGERAARDTSQATTADDESMRIDQDRETQLLDTTRFNAFPGTTQLYTQYPAETPINSNPLAINLEAQGSRPIEEYIEYGEGALTEGMKSYEVQAVKSFISGLRDKYAQRLLSGRLDKVGWKWEKAKEEMQRMIEEGRKRKRNRRSMPAVFYG